MQRFASLDEIRDRILAPAPSHPLDAFARIARTYRDCAPDTPLHTSTWSSLSDADKRDLLDDSLWEYMTSGPTGLY